MQKTDNGEMIPIEKVASELGKTKLRVLVYIQDGLLEGEKREGAWVVTINSVKEFKLRDKGKRPANRCAKSCSRPSSCVGCS